MNARADVPLGIFHDIPIETYHDSAGISNSGLSDFARSPFHFHALHLNPNRPPRAEKAGQLEGNLAHCAILEPAEFDKRYAAGPNISRTTKVWSAFVDSVPKGVYPIKAEQRDVAQAQALSVRSIPDVAALFAVGKPEVSAWWIDPATGELCRCRPDWVHPVSDDSVILVDVKTYASADAREFALQVARKAYARQAALYSDGYELASRKKVLGFVFVATETAWPFASAAYMLPDEWLALARAEIAELMPRFAACRQADTWPSYSDSVQLLDMPAWVRP